MSLSAPPAGREHLHTRDVTCTGYRRADGLWDIEGHITDRKSYTYPSRERGEVRAGEPVHEMWIRLTVDDELTVRAIEAVTDHSPYPTSCPAIVSAYQKVVGLRIGPGWTRALKERLGGVAGCTHLTELLGPIATTAFQTIIPLRQRRDGPLTGTGGARALLNTCHTFSAAGEVVRRLAPDLATPASSPRKTGED